MRTRTKVWIIIAASLVLAGGMIFAGVMSVLGWDFSRLSTVQYESNQHEISEKFSGISVKAGAADLTFVLSEAGICRVECYEAKKEKHAVTVQDGTLEIKTINEKTWYDYIGIHFGAPKIKVYLPEKEYTTLCVRNSTGNVEVAKDFKFESVDVLLSTGHVDFCASASGMIKIKADTGDICVENISADSLDLTVSTGKVTVSDVSCEGDVTVTVSTGETYLTDLVCKSVLSSGDTGDIHLNNVIAAEKFSVERSTGDVKFGGSDAAEIFVKTDTGDVTGSFLSDKVFLAQTDTGSVNVPQTAVGGKCEITTDTGDVNIDIMQ